MADIKWIKIATDIFDNRKIKIIENMPEGDALLVTWFKLLCLAGVCNDDGQIYITKELPYTDESLSVVLGKPLITIRLALSTFQQFGMLELVDDIYRLSNWEKYQNVDGMERVREQARSRMAKSRAKKKALLLEEGNVTGCATVTQQLHDVTEQKKNQEEELDKDKESSSYSPSSLKDDDDLYHLFDKYVWPMSSKIAEELRYLEGEHGTEKLLGAVKNTIEHGGHSVGYVKQCLSTPPKKNGNGSIMDALNKLYGGDPNGKDN